jgi:adenosylhomocysteine nucleosidase
MSAIGIIAALPREVAPLVKGWRREELPGHRVVFIRGDVVVACAGMGPVQAGIAVQAARALAPVKELISIGLAGACDPRLKIGDLVRPGVVIDRRTGERYTDERYESVLVSTDAVVSVAEKERLHAAYDAAAVDMEAATVARLARAHGLGFRAVKAISDSADFEIAWLAKFATTEGQFRERAFAIHAALRPWTWGKVRRLAKSSSKALRTLNEAVRAEID